MTLSDEALRALLSKANRTTLAGSVPYDRLRRLAPDLAAEVLALRAYRARVEAAVERALRDVWEDGNCTGLDGWVGEDRDQHVDQEAINARERAVRKALAALVGVDDQPNSEQP